MERLDGMHIDSASILADPTQCLEAHGDYLFRYAMKHVRDHALAEKLKLQTHLLICKACPTMHQKFVTLHQAGQKYATRDEGEDAEGSGLTQESKARIAKTLRNAAQRKQGNRD